MMLGLEGVRDQQRGDGKTRGQLEITGAAVNMRRRVREVLISIQCIVFLREHLLHSRFRRGDAARSSRVENQLKIYEQLNSRLKLAERDKCIGAMGGVNVDTHEDGISLPQEDVEPRSRSSSGSSGTEAGNLGDLVPRRFER